MNLIEALKNHGAGAVVLLALSVGVGILTYEFPMVQVFFIVILITAGIIMASVGGAYLAVWAAGEFASFLNALFRKDNQ